VAEDKSSVLRQAEDKMRKAVSVNKEELATIRSGRATPALLNKITISGHRIQ
jgi:ribosome recycling factor